MTISISGTASGGADHQLQVRAGNNLAFSQAMGGLSLTVWKGWPVVLREAGDDSVLPETAEAVTAATAGTVKFKFSLDQDVIVDQTDQKGVVLSRAEYRDFTKKQYSVRHKNGQGDLVEVWYAEDQLTAFLGTFELSLD